jgi:hypothetical protein
MFDTTFSFLEVLTLVIALATTAVGIVAVIRSSRSITNWTLLVMASAFAIWMMSNFYSNDVTLPYTTQLFLNRLIFGASLFATSLMPLFLSFVLDDNRRLLRYYSVVSGVALTGISLSPLVAREIVPMLPVTEVVFAPTAYLYFFGTVMYTTLSIILIIKGNRSQRGLKRSQLQVMGWSTVITVLLAMLSNALLPYVFGSYSGSLYGPLFFFFMVAGFGYAIIKQRLFDVRLIIVRSVVYLLILIVFTMLYALTVHSVEIGSVRLHSLNQNTYQSALLAVILIFLFQPMKKFLDVAISSVFYRNNYNESKVLDTLSMILINNSDLQTMTKNITNLINETFRPQKIAVIICNGKQTDLLHTRGFSKKLLQDTMHLFKPVIKHRGSDLIVGSEIETTKIKKLSTILDTELFIKLRGEDGVQGIILLGYKGSGKAYTNRDINLLHVLAREIGLGISNVQKYRKIQSFNQTLQNKIMLATQKLHTVNVELQELNKLKDDFISATSHQLRPQLSNAKGFTELVLQNEENNKTLNTESRENIHLAIKSIDRMTAIVTGILEANVKDKNQIILEKTTFELTFLIKQELQTLQERINKRHLHISTTFYGKAVVHGDRKKCREAIYNILDNAIRYSKRNGEISIELSEVNNNALLVMADNGIGIAFNDKKKLFTKIFVLKMLA